MRFPSSLQGVAWGILLGFMGMHAGTMHGTGEVSAEPWQGISQPARHGGDKAGGDRWTTRDKRLHLVASTAMVGLSFHLLHDRWLYEVEDSRSLAISITALAGVIKELRDRRKTPPTCSYKDLVADGVGILVGVFLFTR